MYPSHMHLLYMDNLSLCACSLCILITISWWISQYVLFRWLYQLIWLMSASMSTTLMDSIRSGFLYIHMAMLSKILTIKNTMPCTVSASHFYALRLTWGPKCPPMCCTPSISANTSNARDAHNAWRKFPPYSLYCHLPISELVIGAIFSTCLAMPHWTLGVPSLLVVALIWQYCIQSSVVY